MGRKTTEIHHAVQQAMTGDAALERRDLNRLKEKHRRAAGGFKLSFWAAIILLNLALWVPLPVQIPQAVRIILAVVAVLFAFSVPLWGIRKHQRLLYLLEETDNETPGSGLDETARNYLKAVGQQGRPLVRAEREVLEQQ